MAVAVAFRAFRSLCWASIDFALPPRCPGCGGVVDGDDRFCVGCWQSLEFLGPPSCIRCAVPIPYEVGSPSICTSCERTPPAFDRAAAAVAYGDVARTVALRLKYGRRPGIARTMAKPMVRAMGEMPAGTLVAAVPLHRWRLWKRGYNQALLIAREVAGQAGLACVADLIERTRATPVLRGLGPRERRAAVRDAFRVPERHHAELAGRTILLVDDVFTSGATAEACAHALKAAGAGGVRLVCWARALREDAAGR